MSQRNSSRRFGFGKAAIAAVVLAGVGAADAYQSSDSRSAASTKALSVRAVDVGRSARRSEGNPAAVAAREKTEFTLPVRYGDLDLSVASDGAVLLARIKTAARRVCESATPQTQLKPHRVADCANETVEGLVRQLDIGTLTLAWSGSRSAGPRETAGRVQ